MQIEMEFAAPKATHRATSVKLIRGLHLTATNRRHIAELITKGMKSGGTKSLNYTLTFCDGDTAEVIIAKRETNDYGVAFWRKSICTVAIA